MNVRLSEIMAHNVEIVNPDATLQECAEKLRRCSCRPLGSSPRCRSKQTRRVLTDRDITLRAIVSARI